MRRCVVVLVAAMLAGCSSAATSATPPKPSPSAQPSAQAAQVLPGGCGSTKLLLGGIPAWVDEAGAHNNPSGLPYVLASPTNAAGFIFGNPLTASRRQGPANKILWVVGVPRKGSALEITGHPIDAPTPAVHVTQPANSSPGEIYPTDIDVPKAGCWHFELAWAGNQTSVDLLYS